MASVARIPHGPPYAPDTATVGGIPTRVLDVPITAVFLFIYVCLAAINITIFRLNRRRNHKFIISGLLGGFCNVRTITCSLRIAWAFNLHNVNLVIAAEILFSAGIILIYIVNLVFAQRILRARHPEIGWSRRLSLIVKFIYAFIGVALVMTIATIVLSFYTLDERTRNICRDIGLFGNSYLLFLATVPMVLLLSAYVPNRSPDAENFGQGSTESKALIVLGSSSLGILLAGFRAGTAYMTPRPIQSPAWYDSRSAFYCFGFVPEVLVLLLFIIARVDLLFKVPENSSKARSFRAVGVLQSQNDALESVQCRVSEKERWK